MKKALILTGGSIRGAFQAGAIKTLLSNQGFKPDIIRGISAGALNAAFLTDQFGRHRDWKEAGQEIVSFWRDEIRHPKNIVKKQYFKGLFGAFFNKYPALLDNSPLRKLLFSAISRPNLISSALDFSVGAVNINSGNIEYRNYHDKDILEFIIASAAIPIAMPPSKIGKDNFFDGGMRDSAPLKSAIEAGAEEVVIISCSPTYIGRENIDNKNVADLMDRLISVVCNEILINDINNVIRINKEIDNGREDKRKICIKLICPGETIPVKLTRFDNRDILNMITQGYKTALNSVQRIE